MFRKRLLAAGLAGGLAGGGCTACNHGGLDVAARPADRTTDAPMTQRNRVHVFLISNSDPTGSGQLCTLRDRLNEAGFAQVHYGQLFHAALFESTARKVHCDDPDARIVVVGYSLGAGAADAVAGRLAADGIRVAALVDIAPVYLSLLGPAGATGPVARRLVISNRADCPDAVTGVEEERLTGVGHFGLPTHPLTVDRVLGVVAAACAEIPPPATPAAFLPLIDNPAPTPRLLPPNNNDSLPPPRPLPQAPGLLVGRPNTPAGRP